MKRAFLFLAVAIMFCNTTLAQEPEPDPNLIWVTDTIFINGFDRILVHPNGNILAGWGPYEVELDGNTGKGVRGFPFQSARFADISPDGKYILERTSMIDYQTLEVIANIPPHSRFLSDSKTLINYIAEMSEFKYITKLATYNIETGEKRISSKSLDNTKVTKIEVSPDRKILASIGYYQAIGEHFRTSLALWDTETLDPICIFDKIVNRDDLSLIKFSPESKLVGFRVEPYELYIYKTDDCTLYKKFDLNNTESRIDGFCFIDENHIGYKNRNETYILRLSDQKIIFKNISSVGEWVMIPKIEKNHSNNSLIDSYQVMLAWDLNKIMTGTSIEAETKIQNPFTVEYKDKTLHIKNPNFKSSQITGQIADLNGKIIRELKFNKPTCNRPIPLELLSGTYFLHIKDGGKEYVSKFWVVN